MCVCGARNREYKLPFLFLAFSCINAAANHHFLLLQLFLLILDLDLFFFLIHLLFDNAVFPCFLSVFSPAISVISQTKSSSQNGIQSVDIPMDFQGTSCVAGQEKKDLHQSFSSSINEENLEPTVRDCGGN